MAIPRKTRLTNEKDADILIVYSLSHAGTDGGSLRRSIWKCSAPSPSVLGIYYADYEHITLNRLRQTMRVI